jgi:hypothetical protein
MATRRSKSMPRRIEIGPLTVSVKHFETTSARKLVYRTGLLASPVDQYDRPGGALASSRRNAADEFIVFRTVSLRFHRRTGQSDAPCPATPSPAGAQVALQRCPIPRHDRVIIVQARGLRRSRHDRQQAYGTVWLLFCRLGYQR